MNRCVYLFSFAKMKDVLIEHSDFTNGIMNECTFKNVFFESSRLQLMEFLKTPLITADCQGNGLKFDFRVRIDFVVQLLVLPVPL